MIVKAHVARPDKSHTFLLNSAVLSQALQAVYEDFDQTSASYTVTLQPNQKRAMYAVHYCWHAEPSLIGLKSGRKPDLLLARLEPSLHCCRLGQERGKGNGQAEQDLPGVPVAVHLGCNGIHDVLLALNALLPPLNLLNILLPLVLPKLLVSLPEHLAVRPHLQPLHTQVMK